MHQCLFFHRVALNLFDNNRFGCFLADFHVNDDVLAVGAEELFEGARVDLN